jgi:arginase
MQRILFFIIIFVVGATTTEAQSKTNKKHQKMETVRLIYPQWQGGDIAKWIPEVKDPEEASRGYYLGAQLLNFLAPDKGQKVLTVPIDTKRVERKIIDGVLDRDVIVRQTKTALDMLNKETRTKLSRSAGSARSVWCPSHFWHINTTTTWR